MKFWSPCSITRLIDWLWKTKTLNIFNTTNQYVGVFSASKHKTYGHIRMHLHQWLWGSEHHRNRFSYVVQLPRKRIGQLDTQSHGWLQVKYQCSPFGSDNWFDLGRREEWGGKEGAIQKHPDMYQLLGVWHTMVGYELNIQVDTKGAHAWLKFRAFYFNIFFLAFDLTPQICWSMANIKNNVKST